MTDLEQDYLLEIARSRDFQDKLIERECQLRSMSKELEEERKSSGALQMDKQNILVLCAELQEIIQATPLSKAEVCRRVLAIEKIVGGK